MAVHDWTLVEAGIFHAFHHDWITEIARALNRGLLPPEYYALPEQLASGLGPDVLTLCKPVENGGNGAAKPSEHPQGGLAVAVSPPRVKLRMQSEANRFAARAKTVAIRHVSNHQVVSMVEIVSPGNKNNQNGLNAFVRKAQEALAVRIHLLLVDLFPPGTRDPKGVHGAVWGEDCGEDFNLPEDKNRMAVSYVGGAAAAAYLEWFGVGDPLPNDMPLFLTSETYVAVPLETTYVAAWEGMPLYWRQVLTKAN